MPKNKLQRAIELRIGELNSDKDRVRELAAKATDFSIVQAYMSLYYLLDHTIEKLQNTDL